MILGSRPVNLVWNHFPWTFGQSYLTETIFFLDSTRHLNLHEMPHLIIKCSQLVILSTCFFWNSLSLLVKNIRTIPNYLRLSFLRLMYSNAVQIAKTYEELFGVILKTGFDAFWYLRCGLTYRLLFFFWGVTTHFSCTPGLQEIPFESLMNFLWIFMIFFCIVLKRSLCKSYAFLMQFLCNLFAFLMRFLCSFKSFIHFCQNFIHFCPKRMKF